MTGPAHYREAERLIANARTANVNRDASAFYLAQAQVHATLAHTAAVIAGAVMSPSDHRDWRAALDPERAAEADR